MAVIFDLGNVVVDWNPPAIVQSLPFDDAVRDTIRRELFEHPDWLSMDRGLKTDRQVTERIVRTTHLNSEHVTTALRMARESLREFPDTIDLMHELHQQRVDLYCLSNMSIESYEFIRDKRFFSLFRGTVISGREKMIKPQSEIFDLLLRRFQLDAGELLFVDDLPVNILAAANLGIDGVVFRRDDRTFRQIRDKAAAMKDLVSTTKKPT